jgi:hypothetical protein
VDSLSDLVMKIMGYVIVPGAMLTAFVLLVDYDSFQTGKRSDSEPTKRVKRFPWGAVAGVVLFLFFLVYAIPSYQSPQQSILSHYGFNIWGAIVGVILGFVIGLIRMFSFHIILKDLFVMIITPILLVVFHSYLFERSYNDEIISGTLGLLLGITLNKILITAEMEKRYQ